MAVWPRDGPWPGLWAGVRRRLAPWCALLALLALAACNDLGRDAEDYALRQFVRQTSIDQRPVYQFHGTSVVRGPGEVLAVFPPDPRSAHFAQGAEVLYQQIQPRLRTLVTGPQLSAADRDRQFEARALVDVSYTLRYRTPGDAWSPAVHCLMGYDLVRRDGAWVDSLGADVDRPLPQCGASPPDY